MPTKNSSDMLIRSEILLFNTIKLMPKINSVSVWPIPQYTPASEERHSFLLFEAMVDTAII